MTCEGACTFCPFGYGLIDGACRTCTGMGCRSCLASALNNCTSCIRGYFLDSASSSCTACPSECTTCVSSTVCTGCASGYTSTATSIFASGFTCLACSSECGSCYGSIDKCTTCADGFQFSGWKCVKKFRFLFGCRLGVAIGFFRLNLFRFIGAIMFGFGRIGSRGLSFGRIR